MPAFPTTVKLPRFVDGDIIEISPAIDGKDTVRLIGVEAPEAKKAGAADAVSPAARQRWSDGTPSGDGIGRGLP